MCVYVYVLTSISACAVRDQHSRQGGREGGREGEGEERRGEREGERDITTLCS